MFHFTKRVFLLVLLSLSFNSSFVQAQLPNQNPVISSSPVTTVNDSELYRYELTAIDADGDLLNYSASELPSWLSFCGYCEGTVSTVAGALFSGYRDGSANVALFNQPLGITVDAEGNLFLVDVVNYNIRKITPQGIVSTLAGSQRGYLDGPGTTARFDFSNDIALDSEGNLYVTDGQNNRIRKITPDGLVSTLVGNDSRRIVDGVGVGASLANPSQIVSKPDGHLYFTDNGSLRSVTPAGLVTTLIRSGEYNQELDIELAIRSIALGNNDDLFFVSQSRIYRLANNGEITHLAGTGLTETTDGPAFESSLGIIGAITMDKLGNLFFVDSNSSSGLLRVLSTDGQVITVAGGAEIFTDTDGVGNEADLVNIRDITVSQNSEVYVTNYNKIRKITFPYALLQGNPSNQQPGTYDVSLRVNDGNGANSDQNFQVQVNDVTPPVIQKIERLNPLSADSFTPFLRFVVTFSEMSNVNLGSFRLKEGAVGQILSVKAGDDEKAVIVTVSPNQRTGRYTLEVNPEGSITDQQSISLIDPAVQGVNEYYDFDNKAPAFALNVPESILVGEKLQLRLTTTDEENHSVVVEALSVPDWLSIAPLRVSTLAGKPETSGNTDGRSEARLKGPTGAVMDKEGNLYFVADNKVRKMDVDGYISTIAGDSQGDETGIGSEARFNSATFITIGPDDYLYVTDLNNHKIKKVSLTGEVTTYAGSSKGSADGDLATATFDRPIVIRYYSGSFYVLDENGIRVISADGQVSTMALVDEGGNPVIFNYLRGLTFLQDGSLIVADTDSYKVHKISSGVVTVLAGSTQGDVDGPAEEALFGNISSLESDFKGNVFVGDVSARKIKKIDRQGQVKTIAGTFSGFKDGDALSSQFRSVTDLYYTPEGDLIISDWNNSVLRKLTLTPELIGTPPETIDYAQVIVSLRAEDELGASNNFEFSFDVVSAEKLVFNSPVEASLPEGSQSQAYQAIVINPDNVSFTLLPKGDADFFEINELDGKVYFNQVTDFENPFDADGNNIYELSIEADNGSFVTVQEVRIEVTNLDDEAPVFTSEPVTEQADDEQYIYALSASDPDRSEVRFKIETAPSWLSLNAEPTGSVTTVAGNGNMLVQNGTGTSASFNNPNGIALGLDGELYIVGNGSHLIRKIDTDGTVSSFAGSVEGTLDGTGTDARFKNPQSITIDDAGNLYLIGSGNKLRKISPDGVVTTLAGSGQQGFADGTGTEAMFNSATGLTVDASGNVYVADLGNHRIRKVAPQGLVTTFAGSGTAAFADGTGTNAAFFSPRAIAFDNTGNLFVADQGNQRIRKITPSGEVTTIAGSGVTGYTDGAATTATFNTPMGVAIDAAGNVYVSDLLNHSIRVISTDGMVTTLAGNGFSGFMDGSGSEAQFNVPGELTIDTNGNLFVVDIANQRIRKLAAKAVLTGNPSGNLGQHTVSLKAFDPAQNEVQQDFTIQVIDSSFPLFTSAANVAVNEGFDGTLYTATVSRPQGVSFSLGSTKDESLFTIDTSSGALTFDSTPDHELPTDANQDNIYQLDIIANNGSKTASLQMSVLINNLNEDAPVFFSSPLTTVADDTPYAYTIDVRDADGGRPILSASQLPDWLQLDPGTLELSTLAGSGLLGADDGTGTAASFNYPSGLGVDATGNIYVADYDNNVVRKINKAGEVSTLAGSGRYGLVDGQGTDASFQEPSGLAIDKLGNIYVSEFNGSAIRKITPDGLVSTIAGTAGRGGYVDGPADQAIFNIAIEIAIDDEGTLYVADYYNHVIRKISTDGIVSTLAGNGTSGFTDGTGTMAQFNNPTDLVVDADGNVYVADLNHSIRKITPEGVVTTMAGSGFSGYTDGLGTAAQFNSPTGITLDQAGNLIVADLNNRRIRKVTPEGMVSTLIGTGASINKDGLEDVASFSSVIDVVMDPNGDFVASTFSGNQIKKITRTPSTLFGPTSGLKGIHSVILVAKDMDEYVAQQRFDITITDATPPVFTSASSVEVQEGSVLAAYDAHATDANELTYSLGTGLDEGLFDISANAGLVIFKTTPDFENPQDTNTDNEYEVEIKVSDGTNEVAQAVTITVTDILEGTLNFTSTPETEVSRDEAYRYIISAKDATASSPTVTAPTLPSWLHLKKLGEVLSEPGKGSYLAEDGNGNIYMADQTRIWKKDVAGNITLVAGGDEIGYEDGTGSEARFYIPQGLAFGPDGNLYVADSRNNRIRKVTPAGVVTTYAGRDLEDWNNIDGPLTEATFSWPSGLVFDDDGNLFVADTRTHAIRKISADGMVSTVAGKLVPDIPNLYLIGPTFVGWKGGYADGPAAEARFHSPRDLALDSKGNIFVTDQINSRIRKISTDGQVTTVAGGNPLHVDGFGENAGFPGVQGIAIDKQDRIFVGELRLRMIDENGYVSTVAGGLFGQSRDGLGVDAKFGRIFDILIRPDGDLYIPEESSEKLRVVKLVDVLEGDPFNDVGTHDVSLTATGVGASVNQDFTITVSDSKNPVVTSILRLDPADELVNSNQVGFEVTFSEPVRNVASSSFTFKSSLLLGEVSGINQLTDSTYFVRVSEIQGAGTLDLNLSTTNSIVDFNNLPLTNLIPEEEESFKIISNTSPVFTSEPVTSIASTIPYSYQVQVSDAQQNGLKLEAITLPEWLKLEQSGFRLSELTGYNNNSRNVIRGLAMDSQGNIFEATANSRFIRKVSPEGTVTNLGQVAIPQVGSSSTFLDHNGIVLGPTSDLYVSTKLFGTIEKIDTRGRFSRFVGSETGFKDGTGAEAQFNEPAGMAIDAAGHLIVADTENHAIRRVTPEGVVTTIAGGVSGYSDGSISTASFKQPTDIAIDTDGNIYVNDQGNKRIRMISSSGEVSTVAGSAASSGDGQALTAGLGVVTGIEFDDEGNLWMTDLSNRSLRVLTKEGVVTTVNILDEQSNIANPQPYMTTLVKGRNGDLFVADNTRILGLEPVLKLTGSPLSQEGIHEVELKVSDSHGAESTQRFHIEVTDGVLPSLEKIERSNPASEEIATEEASFMITFSERLKNIDPTDFELVSTSVSGLVSEVSSVDGDGTYRLTVRGLSGLGEFTVNLATGTDITDTFGNAIDASSSTPTKQSYTLSNTAPQFSSSPLTVVAAASEYSYEIEVQDAENDQLIITTETLPDWLSLDISADVNTIAGTGNYGFTNGSVQFASFGALNSVVEDSKGNLFVTDISNGSSIRKIDTDGIVSSFVSTNGQELIGRAYITIDQSDNIYLADQDYHNIRKISPEGVFSTIAGGTEGHVDGSGTAASFNELKAIDIDVAGNLYVIDTSPESSKSSESRYFIRKISPEGVVTTLVGGKPGYTDGQLANAQLHNPSALTVDLEGNLYFTESARHTIRKISPDGKVSTIAGTGVAGYQDGPSNSAMFNTPSGLALDKTGNLLVSDQSNNRIRMLQKDGSVITLAGSAVGGFIDGSGKDARFNSPTAIVLSQSGNAIVIDWQNSSIRGVKYAYKLTGNSVSASERSEVSLQVSDGRGGVDTQDFTIVQDNLEPVFTSSAQISVDENVTGTIYTAVATDANTVTYSIEDGFDQEFFSIDEQTGQLTFINSPDYDTPIDGGRDNIYQLNLMASDGANRTSFYLTILVENLNEFKPQIISNPATVANSNEQYTYELQAVDLDGDLLDYSGTLPSWLTLTQTKGGEVTTFTGSIVSSIKNGVGTEAAFHRLGGIAVDNSGNVYVSDKGANLIRKITPAGEVSTFAGSGAAAFADGTGIEASFKQPQAIVIDSSGNLIVADEFNHRIRKITPEGVVTTLAGSGIPSHKDGIGSEANMSYPNGLDIGPDDLIYFIDRGTNTIRKLATDGTVSTVRVKETEELAIEFPRAILVKNDGGLRVSDGATHRLWNVDVDGTLSVLAGSGNRQVTDGTGTAASFFDVTYMSQDAEGNVYTVNRNENLIRKVTPQGVVTTVLGPDAPVVLSGYGNSRLSAIVVAGTGKLFVLDEERGGVMEFNEGVDYSLLAGGGKNLLVDGDLESALFLSPFFMTYDKEGNLYITDTADDRIRKVTPDGQVSTVAGKGENGDTDGPVAEATFDNPRGIVVDSKGNIFVADLANHKIRKITPDGMVSTFAGNGAHGAQDGTGSQATFYFPMDLEIDSDDNIYVADLRNSLIRKITEEGVVSTIAGNGTFGYQDGKGTAAVISQPYGLTMDSDENLWIADSNNGRIRKMDKEGNVTTIAGNGERIIIRAGVGTNAALFPVFDLAIDKMGNVYFSNSNGIVRMASDGTVSRFVGEYAYGFKDGIGLEAEFWLPRGLVISPEGDLMVADRANSRIRKVTLPSAKLEGSPAGFGGEQTVSLSVEDPAGNKDTQDFIINVTDMSPPVFTSETAVSSEENKEGAVYTAVATDATVLTYTLKSGLDAAIFQMDGASGELSFINSADYETPLDEDLNNQYEVIIIATDAGNLSSELEITVTVTDADEIAPTVTISSDESSLTNSNPIIFKVTVSETALGFTQDDLTIVNATVSSFTQNGNEYDVGLAPVADGEVSLQVAAGVFTDEAGNSNTASALFSLTSDRTRPVMGVSSTGSGSYNADQFVYLLFFDEAIVGITEEDFILQNATIKELTADGNTYTLVLMPIADGEIDFTIAENSFTDEAGNGNMAWDFDGHVITSDRTAPTVTLSTSAESLSNATELTYTITVSEPTTDLMASDLSITNASISEFSNEGNVYTLILQPDKDGEVKLSVPAGAFTDIAGNENVASEEVTITSDLTKPEMVIESLAESVSNATTLDFKITTSETVVGFAEEDLSLVNATVSSFSSEGNVYAVTLLPTEEGVVKLSVPAGVFTDVVGNSNIASLEVTVTADLTAPVVTITNDQGDPSNANNLVYDIILSEEVKAFGVALIEVQNGSIVSLTGTGLAYVLTVTPLADGLVTVTTTDAIEDLAGNKAATAQNELSSDRTAPVPELSSESSGIIDVPFVLRVAYSESVNGFALEDLNVENGTASDLTAVEAGKEWTLTITPLENGAVKVFLPFGAATDAAGNLSESATQFQIGFQSNVAPTGIGLSNSTVAENSDSGTEVGMLTAVDADEGDSHTFSLVAGLNSDDNDQFSIDGNKLLTNAIFDFETKSQYRIRIRAEDSEGESIESAFTITVSNVGEPQISMVGDLDFGMVGIGATAQLTFSIGNVGDAALTVTSVSLPDGFQADYTSGTIAASASQTVTVTFSPLDNVLYSGTITVLSDAGTGTLNVSGTGQLVTSIDDDIVEAEEVQLYPNPASRIVQIDLVAFKGRPVDVYLVDVSGKIRKSILGIRESSVSLDVSTYEEGLFMVKLNDATQQVTKKLMIKR